MLFALPRPIIFGKQTLNRAVSGSAVILWFGQIDIRVQCKHKKWVLTWSVGCLPIVLRYVCARFSPLKWDKKPHCLIDRTVALFNFYVFSENDYQVLCPFIFDTRPSELLSWIYDDYMVVNSPTPNMPISSFICISGTISCFSVWDWEQWNYNHKSFYLSHSHATTLSVIAASGLLLTSQWLCGSHPFSISIIYQLLPHILAMIRVRLIHYFLLLVIILELRNKS